MPAPDAFAKVKRAILRVLRGGLSPHGFTQFRDTAYFIRDRGQLRDAVFFQKMRSNAVCMAYGMSMVPDGDWSPGLLPHAWRWLKDQEFYRCKYLNQVEQSIGRAVSDFEAEALPWFDRFQNESDLKLDG